MLGTVIDAQRIAYERAFDNPQKIFIVPVTISFHFVLEASSLIEEYLRKTGKEHYYERLPHRGHGFSASPVASDGKIYMAGEDGIIITLEAGDELKLLKVNVIGEPLMATPALADGMMYARGQNHLFAIGK